MAESDDQIVTLTPFAAEKVREFLDGTDKPCLRVSVKLEGPTGFMYDLDMDDIGEPGDLRTESNGIPLLIEGRSVVLIDGTTIDWQRSDDGREGFVFDNPNAVD